MVEGNKARPMYPDVFTRIHRELKALEEAMTISFPWLHGARIYSADDLAVYHESLEVIRKLSGGIPSDEVDAIILRDLAEATGHFTHEGR